MSASVSGVALFPLPSIDYPVNHGHCRTRTTARRASSARRATTVANSVIKSLNHLSMSFATPPYSPRVSVSLNSAATEVSAAQMRLLRRVYERARSFVRHQPHRGSCDHISSNIDCGSPRAAPDFMSYQRSISTPITSDLVSLPSVAGTVDLLSILPPDMAASYADESFLEHHVPPTDTSKRKPRFHGPPDEYVKLIRRLLAAGMVDFTSAPRAVNGLFGVPKDDGSIRLIIDARPANNLFPVPDAVSLPTPDVMANVRPLRGRRFYVAKSDISDFYHRLRLPLWMAPFFALPRVRASDIGLDIADRFGPDSFVHPMCLTLPMGWSHSVLVAQAAHEHLLSGISGFSRSNRISKESDFDPVLVPDRVLFGVYIDDLTLIGDSADEVNALQDRYVLRMDAVGLTTKASKRVRASSDGVESVGLLMHGEAHTIGVAPAKMWRLIGDTRDTIRRGRLSGLDLSLLVGKWSWAVLVTRFALSVFSAVYRFVDFATDRWNPKSDKRWARFDMWPSVRRELETMIDLAPLFIADLSAPYFSLALASDASESGQGLSVAPLLDSRSQSVRDMQWRSVISAPWSRDCREHINELELRASNTGVRWVLSHPDSVGCRVLFWVDSTVVLGILRKGRSSAPRLLRRVRGVAALVLAAGLVLDTGWVPSELNPADAGSRAFDVRT